MPLLSDESDMILSLWTQRLSVKESMKQGEELMCFWGQWVAGRTNESWTESLIHFRLALFTSFTNITTNAEKTISS